MADTITILVTGAGGFVGRYLMPALRQRWPAARCIGTGLHGDEQCRALDVCDADAVARLVAEVKPQLTIHLAAQASVGKSFSEEQKTWNINLQGSLNLFAALRQHVANSALMFISSSDVYGASFKAGIALSEDALLQPLNPYAASKAAADLAAGQLAASSDLRVVRMRPFNHSGAGQAQGFVLPDFAAQIARIERGEQGHIAVGNLTAQRDFLHVADVADAYVGVAALLLRNDPQLQTGEVLNVASGQPVAISQWLQQMVLQANCTVDVVQDAARIRPSDIALAAGDASRLRQLTGWQPKYDQQRLVAELLDAYR